MSLHVPDVRQHDRDPEAGFRVALMDRPQQCGSQILLLLKRSVRVPWMVHARWLYISSKIHKTGEMPLTQVLELAGVLQSFPCVLADCLQIAKAYLFGSLILDNQERLIEKLLQQCKNLR